MMLKSLIEEFEQEVNNTRRLFDAIPEKDLDYKPASVSWTLAELAQHIAGIYTLYPGVFTQDEINMANVPKPGDAKDWDATLELFERSVERARAVLNSVEEASLEQSWTFKAGNQVIMGP